MEKSSTYDISNSLGFNTLFHEITLLNIKTFWYFVHVISWNNKPQKRYFLHKSIYIYVKEQFLF